MRCSINWIANGRVRLNDESTEEEKRAFWKRRAHAEAEIDDALAVRPEEQRRLMWDVFERQVDGLGVACFSECADDIPMWGYYADSHRGLCLRFQAALLLGWEGCSLAHVTYEDDYPDVYFYRDSDFRRSQAITATKAKVWAHEREWPLVRRVGGESMAFNPATLDCVIMGCRIEAADRERVRDVLDRRDLAVSLLKAELAEREFKLVIGLA